MSFVELSPPRALGRIIHRLEDDHKIDGAARVVDQVASVVRRGGAGSILRGDWLGHALHPLLSDLPLGCWTAAAVLDLTTGRRGNVAARRLVGSGLLFAIPTAAAGLAEFGTLTEQRSRRVAVVHATGNAIAMVFYLGSWRARRHGHHLVGKAASTLGGVLAVGTGYLGGHLSFVLGAGSGARGRIRTAIALPEHAGDTQPPRTEGDVVAADDDQSIATTAGVDPRRSGQGVGAAPSDRCTGTTDSWPTVEVVTPAVTDDQRKELQELPHCMAETEPSRLPPASDELRTAFRFPPAELTLENLRALSAEASRIAGAARLRCQGDDPEVARLVDQANAG